MLCCPFLGSLALPFPLGRIILAPLALPFALCFAVFGGVVFALLLQDLIMKRAFPAPFIPPQLTRAVSLIILADLLAHLVPMLHVIPVQVFYHFVSVLLAILPLAFLAPLLPAIRPGPVPGELIQPLALAALQAPLGDSGHGLSLTVALKRFDPGDANPYAQQLGRGALSRGLRAGMPQARFPGPQSRRLQGPAHWRRGRN